MKIIRSTKCSTKFMTAAKQSQLAVILKEYSKVVNFFINCFWNNPPSKAKLLKPIVDLPTSWLSARLRKVAAREALDMISASKERRGPKAIRPEHHSDRMFVSSTIADLQSAKTKAFDAWLHLSSIGRNIIFDIPIKFHDHYNKWNAAGKRLNAYIITKDYIQFMFEIETGSKITAGQDIGIDTGINALASTSTKNQYGEIKALIQTINRKQKGSNKQQKVRRHLKHLIDETVKQIVETEQPRLIAVEKLKDITKNTKKRLPKEVRRLISNWNHRYWLTRLQQKCEENRVTFRTVSAYNTSITCSRCGNADKKQRFQEDFVCLSCDHAENADTNAATNILNRCLSGIYRPAFIKPNHCNE